MALADPAGVLALQAVDLLHLILRQRGTDPMRSFGIFTCLPYCHFFPISALWQVPGATMRRFDWPLIAWGLWTVVLAAVFVYVLFMPA